MRGGDAAFGDLGEVLHCEGRSRRICSGVFGAMRAMRTVGSMGLMGGCDRSRLFPSCKQSLLILVFYAGIMFGLDLGFLLVVCLLGFLEDIDKVLALLPVSDSSDDRNGNTDSADHLARLINYRDCLHQRHLGGLY